MKNATLADFYKVNEALDRYAQLVGPWAELRAGAMVEQVNRQDFRAWTGATKEMSAAIRRELRTAPVGERMKGIMAGQVALIKSLPKEAAERVHKLVLENVESQRRPNEIAKEIAKSGKVTSSRATLIARTEVSRASTILTQARAEHIGGEGYIWHTVHDGDVRPSHKKMEGKFVAWDNPPTLDGLTGHAGALPNCRCFPEPVIPEELL